MLSLAGTSWHPASVLHRIDDATGGPARRYVITVFAAVLALDSADKAAVGASATQLQHGLHIGHTGIGVLLATSSIVGALATVPAGILTDRHNRTRLLSGAVISWGIAMLLSSLAVNFATLIATHLVLGIVTAVAGPVLASLLGDYFPEQERGKIYGYVLTGELAGAGFGFMIAGNAASLSWRAAFAVLVPPTALVWWLVQRLPEPARGGASRLRAGRKRLPSSDARPVRSSPAPDHVPFLVAAREVLSVRTNVRLIVASALGYFWFSGLRGFGVEYAKQHYRVPQSAATSLILVLGAGAVIGVLFGGRLADRLQRNGRRCARLEVPCVLAVIAAALIVPGILVTSALIAVPVLFLAMIFLGGVNPPLDAARLDIMPARLWGRAEAVRSVLRNLGDAGAPLLFGVFAGHVFHGGTALELTLLVTLGTVFVAAVLMFRGRHSYPEDVRAAAA